MILSLIINITQGIFLNAQNCSLGEFYKKKNYYLVHYKMEKFPEVALEVALNH